MLTLWGNLDAPEVTPQVMGWGITLAQFYLGEARRLAEAGLVSEETAKAERLRQWLVESWAHDEVTPREIVQSGPNALREGKALAGIRFEPAWVEDDSAPRMLAPNEPLFTRVVDYLREVGAAEGLNTRLTVEGGELVIA